jgi:hypothetical protein
MELEKEEHVRPTSCATILQMRILLRTINYPSLALFIVALDEDWIRFCNNLNKVGSSTFYVPLFLGSDTMHMVMQVKFWL